ncbi:popeye domain-containing protein 3-like isoform X2 [Tachypleus tridentatus]|uniref:popeye domain-containing protein 3-like isoform X2 n=1 Tax=Tachypleus tridentatus TaxID=6853 RepID=UPI003FD5A5B6
MSKVTERPDVLRMLTDFMFNSVTNVTNDIVSSTTHSAVDRTQSMENYTESNFLPPNSIGVCANGWLPPNHLLFQLANTFLFLSYMAPTGIHGLLYLRATLMLACLFFSLWAWLILCAFDTFLWNAIFTVLNLVHVCIILYMLRPVRFTHEIELLYQDLFKPLHTSRRQFQKALACMKEIQTLKAKEQYCLENVTHVDRLSLVLSGRLIVSQGGHQLHIIDSHQFLDSPEWFGVTSDDCYQVTVTALEESRLIVWHRDKLKLSICGDTFLQAVFDNILGKDVVKKLMLITETSTNEISVCGGENPAETSRLLAPSKEVRTGMDVVLNRHLDSPEHCFPKCDTCISGGTHIGMIMQNLQ